MHPEKADIEKQLKSLTKNHPNDFTATEVVDIVEKILASFGQQIDQRNLDILNDLKSMARTIQKMRDEMHTVDEDGMKSDDISSAHDELDAVIMHTEKATNEILDATEKIQEISGSMEDELKQKIIDQTTIIFEASNFQDITGQRITKVVTSLKRIEEKLAAMLAVFGYDLADLPKNDKKEEDLLNGPQLPDNACNQDEIDAILASFD